MIGSKLVGQNGLVSPGGSYQPYGSTEAISGLEFSGNEDTTLRRMILFDSPFPIYDATYIFRVFPREKTTGTNPRYYTTFFWGNNGEFAWDSGTVPNTYYGGHPYPVPSDMGPGQWEISTNANDYVTGNEVEWDRWFTQVFVAWRESAALTHHHFYWDWDAAGSPTSVLTRTNNDVTWADGNPPAPCICVGQAPDPWGHNAGFEEFKGIIRGMQFYDTRLTLAQIASELANPGSARTPWYLNLNPTPDDISDKSGSGNHPTWEGADRPTLWTP